MPVVVILYSESWSRAGTTFLPCEDLAAEGVVVVTVAYRLHFLAFYTQKSANVRGNLSLLDQYLALLWVRDNIAAFGGNPASITLMGHSAGADSILYHIASQRTVGLFNRAIVMSPRDIWRVIEEDSGGKLQDESELASRMIAHALGCSVGTNEVVLHCLRSRSMADIIQAYSKMNVTGGMHPIPDDFLPVTEQYLPTTLADAFSVLTTSQQTVQLDLLLGSADLEAIDNNHEQYQEFTSQGKETILTYAVHKAIQKILRMLSLHNSNDESVLTVAILWEYWSAAGSNSAAARDTRHRQAAERFARMESSARWGAASALLGARLARRLARLYVYRYSQPGGTDLMGRHLNYTGAAHGTDLVAILGDAMMLQVARRPANVDEQRTSAFIRRYFVNFIKFGYPTEESEWARYRVGEAHVHSLRDQYSCDERSPSRDVAFWLQYLPHLAGLFAAGGTEKLPLEQAVDGRLRGGVFALCGVSLALLALLAASGAALRAERARRAAAAAHDLPDLPQTNL